MMLCKKLELVFSIVRMFHPRKTVEMDVAKYGSVPASPRTYGSVGTLLRARVSLTVCCARY